MKVFSIIGHTEKGPVRMANEDHILVARFIKNHGRIWMSIDGEDDFLARYGILLAVADGVGGEAGGAVASQLALTTVERHFYGVEKAGRQLDGFAEVLKDAAVRANETILSVAAGNLELAGMGCTLTGICLTPEGHLIFNAGDSRVYRYRNGLLPLTTDDSVTSLMVQTGRMTYEEAESSALRHTITNSMGSPSFRLSISRGRELRDGDIFLICSDGLHDLVPEVRMDAIISQNRNLDRVMTDLISEAVNNGGHDNISAIFVQFAHLDCGGEKGTSVDWCNTLHDVSDGVGVTKSNTTESDTRKDEDSHGG